MTEEFSYEKGGEEGRKLPRSKCLPFLFCPDIKTVDGVDTRTLNRRF